MNIPKEDGYYWYKDEEKLTIVKVNNAKYFNRAWNLDASRVYFIGDDTTHKLYGMEGEFISKITPPTYNKYSLPAKPIK